MAYKLLDENKVFTAEANDSSSAIVGSTDKIYAGLRNKKTGSVIGNFSKSVLSFKLDPEVSWITCQLSNSEMTDTSTCKSVLVNMVLENTSKDERSCKIFLKNSKGVVSSFHILIKLKGKVEEWEDLEPNVFFMGTASAKPKDWNASFLYTLDYNETTQIFKYKTNDTTNIYDWYFKDGTFEDDTIITVNKVKYVPSLTVEHLTWTKFLNLTHLSLNGYKMGNLQRLDNNKFSIYKCIEADLSMIDTSYILDMSNAFFGIGSYYHNYNINTRTKLNLKNWNTSNVTKMSYMFGETNIESLDLSMFNTSKCYNMFNMFTNNYYLKELDLSTFILCTVAPNYHTDIIVSEMFSYSKILKIILPNLITDNSVPIKMERMFYNCNNLLYLDLSNWNVNTSSTITSLFYKCNSLTYVKCTKSFKNFCQSKWNDMITEDTDKSGPSFNSITWELTD